MTQPSFVPIAEADQVRPARRLQVPEAWSPTRPAELHTPGQPAGTRLGTPGPDQGYALGLARRLEDELHLGAAEDIDDVLVGAALVATRRAAAFGRAPTIHDLRFAYMLFGYLLDQPPNDLVDERRRLFRAASRDYVAQRALADRVAPETLRLTSQEVEARLGQWQELLNG